MESEGTRAPVAKVSLQAQGDAAEGEIVPRDFGFPEQGGFQAFLAGIKTGVEHSSPIEQMDLVDVRDVYQRKKVVNADARASFFERLAQGGLRGRLAVFHEACGQRP